MKLEKVEIGGIRGKALTSNIGKVYEEFKVKLVFWHPCSIDIATWSGSLLQSFLLNCLNFVALTQQHGLVSGSLQCIQSPILRQSWSKRSRLPERLREVQRPGFLPGQVPPNNRKSQMAKSNQRTGASNQIVKAERSNLITGSLEQSSVELLTIASSRRVFSSCFTYLVEQAGKQ